MKVVVNRTGYGIKLDEAAYRAMGLPWDGRGDAFTDSSMRTNPRLVAWVESEGLAWYRTIEIQDGTAWKLAQYCDNYGNGNLERYEYITCIEPLEVTMHHYILQDGKPVLVDPVTWALWRCEENARVALDEVGPMTVSTVFIGLAPKNEDPPQLWETRETGPDHDSITKHASLEAALAYHQAAVVRASPAG